MNKSLKIFMPLFWLSGAAAAQSLFPGIQGTALLDSLVKYYKPSVVLDYNAARDKMYAVIDNHNDSVTCVYTGYKVYVPYDYPAPRDLTNNASPKMDAEHSWPKSKGADDPGDPRAISDLNHIYPTNSLANSARGSLPFGIIPEDETDRWWFGVGYIIYIPATQKELYSREKTGVRFEPRDDHKGNLARSMFYFYTMYRPEADAADPNFFAIQKDDFFAWHKADPVDTGELERANMIAVYQDGKTNPFILDSTLVRRCYFSIPATSIKLHPDAPADIYELQQNYPNPFNGMTWIGINLSNPSGIKLTIFDTRGSRVAVLFQGILSAGHHSFSWTAGPGIASGVYYCRMQITAPVAILRIKKMLLIQ
jgi:endonuclease I